VRRNDGVGEVWQVYGLGGELLAEYAAGALPTSPRKEYGYRGGELLVTAESSGGWGPEPAFTGPDPLKRGDAILLEHLTDLRAAVNQLRRHAGLSDYDFTADPEPQRNVTAVRAEHIRQLRAALEEALTRLGLPSGGYAHPALTENSSLIYAADFQELREQVRGAWRGDAGGVDIRWVVSDQLGTPRMAADRAGSLAGVTRHDYLPFGEELGAGVGGRTQSQGYSASDGMRQKFAGKEQDNETSLNYFVARYYASTQGRFTSADPLGGRMHNPQSLNKYSYVINNPLRLTDPTGMYVCADSTDKEKCSSKEDKEFEKARQHNLKSKDPDVVRAAKAYGDPNADNHVTVSFEDLDKKGEGGNTTSTLGVDDTGKLFAKSDVVINSNLSGTALDAAVAHEGSHTADAQDVVSSITITQETGEFKVGQDITRYQSEQRAYHVTDSVLRSANETYHFGCGPVGDCTLGIGLRLPVQVTPEIDRILANSPLYKTRDGKPISPTNQGGSVVNGLVVPH
jgi:RHS repeat-associated protein